MNENKEKLLKYLMNERNYYNGIVMSKTIIAGFYNIYSLWSIPCDDDYEHEWVVSRIVECNNLNAKNEISSIVEETIGK